MLFLFALLVAASAARPEHTKINFDSTCSFCEFIIQTAEGYILNNATEQQILQLLSGACTLLPSPYNSLCSQEVNQYGPQIIIWIANKENPEVVCTQLHLCTSSKVAPHALGSFSFAGQACGICEMAITVGEQWLQSGAGQAELEQNLDNMCAILPSEYSAQCEKLVAAQLPAMVSWLVSNQPPQVFCTEVGLCSSTDRKSVV